MAHISFLNTSLLPMTDRAEPIWTFALFPHDGSFLKRVLSCSCERCGSKGRIWAEFHWDVGGHVYHTAGSAWLCLDMIYRRSASSLSCLSVIKVYSPLWLPLVRVTSKQKAPQLLLHTFKWCNLTLATVKMWLVCLCGSWWGYNRFLSLHLWFEKKQAQRWCVL